MLNVYKSNERYGFCVFTAANSNGDVYSRPFRLQSDEEPTEWYGSWVRITTERDTLNVDLTTYGDTSHPVRDFNDIPTGLYWCYILESGASPTQNAPTRANGLLLCVVCADGTTQLYIDRGEGHTYSRARSKSGNWGTWNLLG